MCRPRGLAWRPEARLAARNSPGGARAVGAVARREEAVGVAVSIPVAVGGVAVAVAMGCGGERPWRSHHLHGEAVSMRPPYACKMCVRRREGQGGQIPYS